MNISFIADTRLISIQHKLYHRDTLTLAVISTPGLIQTNFDPSSQFYPWFNTD